MLARQAHQSLMREPAGCRDQRIGRKIFGAIMTVHGFPIEAFDRFLGAEDGLAQRMVLPEIGRENFVDKVIRVVLLHFQLFEDHAFFLGDVLFAEQRMQDQVG